MQLIGLVSARAGLQAVRPSGAAGPETGISPSFGEKEGNILHFYSSSSHGHQVHVKLPKPPDWHGIRNLSGITARPRLTNNLPTDMARPRQTDLAGLMVLTSII